MNAEPRYGLVSVVVPAFNAERWIGETLDSVLSQDYAHLEVIVVDDGSTDGTAAIVQNRGAQDARVWYVRQSNRGLGAARNRGMSEARGEYLAFIDADDLWAPSKIRLQLALIAPHPGSVVLSGIRRFRDTNSGREWLHDTDVPPLGEGADALRRVLLLANGQMALFTTALFRTRELAALGGWAEHVISTEDWELWLRAVRTLSVRAVRQPLLLYRKHSASITARARPQHVLRLQLLLIERERLKGGIPQSVLMTARRAKLLEFAEAATWQGDLRTACKLWTSGLLRHGGFRVKPYYRALPRLASSWLDHLSERRTTPF